MGATSSFSCRVKREVFAARSLLIEPALTLTLSRGEREQPWGDVHRVDRLVLRRAALAHARPHQRAADTHVSAYPSPWPNAHPLPKGEGWGEGEETVRTCQSPALRGAAPENGSERFLPQGEQHVPTRPGPSRISVAQRPAAAAGRGLRLAAAFLFAGALTAAAAPVTNAVPTSPALPDLSVSMLRVFGALAVVLTLFFVGAWVFRNWQRVMYRRRPGTQLQILELRSLGNRQALFVVQYEQQRLLLASSPAGVNLLTTLPPATETAEPAIEPVSFANRLQQMLTRS